MLAPGPACSAAPPRAVASLQRGALVGIGPSIGATSTKVVRTPAVTIGTVVVAVVTGCSSTFTPTQAQGSAQPRTQSSTCDDIVGIGLVADAKLTEECPAGTIVDDDTPNVLTIEKDGDGFTYAPQETNTVCPETLDTDTCRYTAPCRVVGVSGDVIVTEAVDFIFESNDKFTGTSEGSVFPPAVPDRCSATYEESGTRR